MQRLRVLHVTPYCGDAWAYGGIPRLADALARALVARGHDVTVCATDACSESRRLTRKPGQARFAPWPPRRTDGGYELCIFPNVSNRMAYDQCFLPLGLRAYLRTHVAAFDVAHLHACRNIPGVIAARRLRQARVPYVLAPNGTAPRLERRIITKRVFDAVLGQQVLDDAAMVLAVTHAEHRQLTEIGVPCDRIATVPNPVAVDDFGQEPSRGRFRARFNIMGPVVAYLGKLTPRKRVDLLVRAFAALSERNCTLVVAGNDMGGGAAARAAADHLGMSGRTVFTGLLEGRDRIDLLADADVLVYPSEHEIFGLVPLEALLAGTPVVVADDSGCGEVVAATGGGLVVRGNVESIGAAIEMILRSPAEWRTHARRAAARVRSMYAPDVVSAQLEEVYRNVVERR